MKFQFSIRTRGGQIVDNLRILGTDQADAEIKLRQLYRNAEVTKCERVDNVIKLDASSSIENILSLISFNDETVHDESEGLIIRRQELPNLSLPDDESTNLVSIASIQNKIAQNWVATSDSESAIENLYVKPSSHQLISAYCCE